MRVAVMNDQQKQDFNRLNEEMRQLTHKLNELSQLPAVYGYARVSTVGQAKRGGSLEEQKQMLEKAGADNIFSDVFSGTKSSRPEFDRMMSELRPGDTLVVTKLDRLSRSLSDGSKLITELTDRGVKVNVLNLGMLDAETPNGRLMIHMLLAFAEFERDMIYERMQEGREAARKRPGYREGRPRMPKDRIDTAMELLNKGNSYAQVAKKTGISVSSIARERRRRKADQFTANEP